MEQVIRALTVDKAGSESGLIRTAMARQAISVTLQTFGLGAGAGSVTSNGLLFVWLSNIGIPGTALFMLFF